MQERKKSFTLIELLIVVAVFSIITEAIVGVFAMVLYSQRKILEEQEILNQISYAIEYMGRSIRMAKKDDLSIGGVSKDCLSGFKTNYESPSPSEIKFRNYHNQCQRFYLDGGKIAMETIDENVSTTLYLTSPKLKITSLKFNILGQEQTDEIQPRVTIFLEVEKGGRKFQFQTTVSQRDLDVEY